MTHFHKATIAVSQPRNSHLSTPMQQIDARRTTKRHGNYVCPAKTGTCHERCKDRRTAPLRNQRRHEKAGSRPRQTMPNLPSTRHWTQVAGIHSKYKTHSRSSKTGTSDGQNVDLPAPLPAKAIHDLALQLYARSEHHFHEFRRPEGAL
jgi:hypothetical protein